MPRPLTRDELEKLHVAYLDGAGVGHDLDPWLAWAGERVESGGQLLERSDVDGLPGYHVPDHLVEYIFGRDEPVRPPAWKLALKSAKASEALAIGDSARELRERKIAVQAFKRAYKRTRKGSRTNTTAAFRCAIMLRALGRHDEALPYLADAVAGGNRQSAFVLFNALSRAGTLLAEAPKLLRPGVKKGNRAAALLLGNVQHKRANLDRAETLYRAAEEGPLKVDRPIESRARVLRAFLAEQRGDHAAADELFAAGWDPDQWPLIDERLQQVGLDLTAARDALAARTGAQMRGSADGDETGTEVQEQA